MYTAKNLKELIPATYKQYGLVSVNAKGARVFVEKDYPTVGCVYTSAPCVYCGKDATTGLGSLFHPLLRLVAQSLSSWPIFCDIYCVRKYILENQVELLLSLTA